jgi:hypothetical protein
MSDLLDKMKQTAQQAPQRAAPDPIPTEVADVRTIKTGILVYNLMRYTIDEIGLDNLKHQLEEVRAQQKMVAMPPQYDQIVAAHEDIKQRRWIIANEINLRFADIDDARATYAAANPLSLISAAAEIQPTADVLAGFASPVEPADGG